MDASCFRPNLLGSSFWAHLGASARWAHLGASARTAVGHCLFFATGIFFPNLLAFQALRSDSCHDRRETENKKEIQK